MKTISKTSLSALYRELNTPSVDGQQELRLSKGKLYLKMGKALLSVQNRRQYHREEAIRHVINAMTREYGMSHDEARSQLHSVQADAGKITVSDLRKLHRFHHEHIFQVRQQAEKGNELQQTVAYRRQRQASAIRAQRLSRNISTHQQLRSAIIRRHGKQTLALLDEKLPTFMHTKGMLTPHHINTIGQHLNSQEVANFKKAITMVALNPNSPVNSQAARTVAIELAKLPAHLLKKASAAGLTIRVTHDNVTTYYPQLAGTAARGHHGSHWETLPGVGAFGNNKETVIAMQQNSAGRWNICTNHGSANLVLHEFGHSIDLLLGAQTIGNNLSRQSAFYAAWHNDYHQLGNSYFQQAGPAGDYQPGLEESFAEGLARLYGNRNSFAHWPTIEAELMNF